MWMYLQYEWHRQFHNKINLWMPISFFTLINLIMPFTMPAGTTYSPFFILAILWMGLLLSCFLGTDSLFLEDKKRYFTDYYRLYHLPYEALFLIKMFVFMVLRIGGLLLIVPIVGLFWNISIDLLIRFMVMTLVASPAIIFFVGFGSLLLSLLEENHFLIFLLIFPLIIPALIFAATGCYVNTPLLDSVSLPVAFSVLAICITSFASAPLMVLLQDC